MNKFVKFKFKCYSVYLSVSIMLIKNSKGFLEVQKAFRRLSKEDGQRVSRVLKEFQKRIEIVSRELPETFKSQKRVKRTSRLSKADLMSTFKGFPNSCLYVARFHSQFDDYLRSMIQRRKRSLYEIDSQDEADRCSRHCSHAARCITSAGCLWQRELALPWRAAVGPARCKSCRDSAEHSIQRRTQRSQWE